jgi:plastocyanin
MRHTGPASSDFAAVRGGIDVPDPYIGRINQMKGEGMRLRRLLMAVVLAMGTLVGFSAPSHGDTFRVRMTGDSPSNFAFRPKTTHAPTGSRVVWKNRSNVTHHVVAYGGNWSYNKTVPAGDSVAKRFPDAGTFKFRCDIAGHSTLSGGQCDGMCGKVVTH